MAAGIETRHGRRCGSRAGKRCNCSPSYRAHVWSPREQKMIRQAFPTLADAKTWQREAAVAVDQGRLQAPSATTIEQAGKDWLAKARAGSVRNRSGDPYKPSAIRAYEQQLRLRINPKFGDVRLADLRTNNLQDYVDEMVGEGMNPSTIQGTLWPLRAIYRRAVSRGELVVNPTRGLELPAVRGGRDRIASPTEAHDLITAVPEVDRAVWATAMYAGLRRGEMMALRWQDLDFDKGLIHVERSWDVKAGPVAPKSRVGERTVPIPAVLRSYLAEQRLRSEWKEPDALVFGRQADKPFEAHRLSERADAAWNAAKLNRITLHEARHTFASLMIAAGVNAKALSTYMGHANIGITLDKYGHLMPGNEAEAADLLHSYLARAEEAV